MLGCLLGLGIGDALGMPVEGLTRQEIAERHGWVTDYLPRLGADGDTLLAPGEFTDATEIALCHVESLVSTGGFVDPAGVAARLTRLAQSDSGAFLDRTTRLAVEQMEDSETYQDGVAGDWPAGSGAAAQIAPVALMHALGRFNAEVFTREVMRASFITHSDPESVNGALAMAYAVWLLASGAVPPEVLLQEVASFIDEDEVARRIRLAGMLAPTGGDPERDVANLAQIGTSSYVAEAVAAALYCFAAAPEQFERAVLTAVNAGGDASTIGAMAGALSGVHLGAEAIPERLIEGLEGRMYILMAGPGLYRAALRRSGLFLRLEGPA